MVLPEFFYLEPAWSSVNSVLYNVVICNSPKLVISDNMIRLYTQRQDTLFAAVLHFDHLLCCC